MVELSNFRINKTRLQIKAIEQVERIYRVCVQAAKERKTITYNRISYAPADVSLQNISHRKKMNKESPEAINFIFIRAINVYFEKEDKNTAILRIHKKFGTNESSSGMYIRIISSMLKGERYKRGMSATATDNILRNFYSYNNEEFFNNSIHSLKQYINHYENNNGTIMHKLREVLSKWSAKMTKG